MPYLYDNIIYDNNCLLPAPLVAARTFDDIIPRGDFVENNISSAEARQFEIRKRIDEFRWESHYAYRRSRL